MAFKKYAAKKDPNSQVDYGRRWGGANGWLDVNETIDNSIWIINATDLDEEPIPSLEMVASGISTDGKDTSIWLKGGTADMSYTVTNRIDTNQNRTEDRTGIIFVEEK